MLLLNQTPKFSLCICWWPGVWQVLAHGDGPQAQPLSRAAHPGPSPPPFRLVLGLPAEQAWGASCTGRDVAADPDTAARWCEQPAAAAAGLARLGPERGQRARRHRRADERAGQDRLLGLHLPAAGAARGDGAAGATAGAGSSACHVNAAPCLPGPVLVSELTPAGGLGCGGVGARGLRDRPLGVRLNGADVQCLLVALLQKAEDDQVRQVVAGGGGGCEPC